MHAALSRVVSTMWSIWSIIKNKWGQTPFFSFGPVPAHYCDDGPYCLHHAERPSALEKSVHRAEHAGSGEAEDVPAAALLKRVADHHQRDRDQAEGAQRVHGWTR